jgi:2-keto-4-pentenoate hydratase
VASSAAAATAVRDEAVERLLTAARTGVPCAPVRDILGTTDVDAAYGVQAQITRAGLQEGRRLVGRKIGLTSPAVQAQLGVDQPDSGVLFADMRCEQDEPVPMARLLQPKAEAEVAFMLSADLDGEPSTADVAAATACVVAAIEVVDSRVAGWDIRITDTVADNASSGLFVLGDEQVPLAGLDLKALPRIHRFALIDDGLPNEQVPSYLGR